MTALLAAPRAASIWAWRTDHPLERAAGVVVLAMLTAACAQVTIPVPGSPVPVTLQTFSVVLAGLTLGPRLGAASMTLYALMGLLGLPVYADASGGLRVALGATGGYLAGFVVAAACAGMVARMGRGAPGGAAGRTPSAGALVLAALAANVLVFALGVPWLKMVLACDWGTALDKGLWPYLPGTLVKIPMSVAAAAGLGVMSRVR